MSEEFKSDDQALPLYDQSALNTIAGFMSTMFRLHDIKQERCLPARVVEYDRNTNKATVSPIVKYSTTTSEGKKHIDRPEYDNIYVLGFGSSRYSVTAPLVKGDLGILVSCDRSWSAAKEVNSEEDPEKNQGSMPADNDLVSSFENGIFIPCSFADCDIPDDYKKALVIKALSESGNNRKVVIDADDLDKTDAKFRDAIVISREIDEETGKQRFVYKKHKVLMDEGSPVDTKSVDDGTSSISVGYMNAYFSIYAPADREGYSIRAGRVCVDDDQFVDVPEPEDPLDPELEYYCCVKIIRDTGIIAGAEIISFDKIEKKDDESDEDYNKRIEKQKKQFEEYNPEDFDTCRRWIVPIGNIDEDGTVTQYHIGAINLSSDVGERPDFKIYISGYNTETGCYKYNIAGGQVVANGKLIDVEGVEDIELETDYWCKVTFKRQTQATLEKLEAEIVDEEPIYPTLDTEIVWKVKIGQATSSAIVQNHIGAVTFSMPNRTLWFNGEEITRFFGSKDADLAQWFIETQYWPAFSCRWVSGSNECEFFLPNGSAYYNGKAVDFSTNFEVTTGDWKQPTEEVDMSGTIYCWIGLKYTELGSSYTAHFSNSIKGLGTDEENENVVLCFPVCSIGQTGETVTDGITQIASGEMIFGDHFTFAFKIEKIFDNWEIFLPAGSVVRMHKSDSDSDKGVIKFDPLDISDDMAAGESGRDDWYDIPNVSSGTSVYAVFTQDREDPETEGSAPGKYKRNFTSYEIKTSVTSTDRYIKIAKIVGGTSNIVEQIVESAIVLKEDSKHVDSIIGENTQSGTEIISSEKIDGDIEISGRLDPDDEGSSCGITFTTISAREASGGDPARPARIVANIKNRDANEENWGVHEIKFSDTSGQRKTAHVFACEDIEIGDISNVIGSDYIDVNDKTVEGITKREVRAKIITPDPDPAQGEEQLAHALITSDTDQKIRCVKTFTGTGTSANNKRVIVDGPNGKAEVINTDEKKIILDAGNIPNECNNNIDVHWLKYKDLNNVTHIYYGLFCDNIDLTKDGKLIKKVDISQSSASGGRNVIVFTYTDDSQDTIIIYNGQNGNDGAPGQDGETPEIEIEDIGTGMHGVFVDGELKATIKDGENGVSPIITMGPGTGTPKEYPILSNGIPIGSVHDGADGASGSVTEQEFITDITFSRSGSSIIATITKKKGKIIELSAVPNVTKTVLTGTAQSVVESEAYSTSTRQFTNTRKSVVVLSSTSDIGQTVFTAEPHSMT